MLSTAAANNPLLDYHWFALLHLISVMTNTLHSLILLKCFIACGLGAQNTHCKHLLDGIKSVSEGQPVMIRIRFMACGHVNVVSVPCSVMWF